MNHSESLKQDGYEEQDLSPYQAKNRTDLKNNTYLRIKTKPDGSEEQDLSPNQAKTERI